MDGFILMITLAFLCIVQLIVFIFVEPKIPIKLKETDTLQLFYSNSYDII